MNFYKINKYIKVDLILKILFWYRIALCFLMEFFIQNITRRGDTLDYLNTNPVSVFREQGINTFINGTHLAEFTVGAVNSVINNYLLTNIFFTVLAYLGIRAFLKAVPCKNDRHYKVLLLLCFLPTFNIWSSVAGKEALTVFAMGIISAEVVNFFSGEKVKTGFLFFLSLFLVIVIKQQYVPAVLQVILYIVIRQRLRISKKTDFFLLTALILINILIVYIARNFLIDYSLHIRDFFRVDGRSTRGTVFKERSDFFMKMPYMMPLAMWGPNIYEIFITKLHLITFIESFFLFSALLFLFKDFIFLLFKDFMKYYQCLVIFIIGNWWLFLAQYLQGVMNSGAAIRYRTNLFLLMTALFFIPFIVKNLDNEQLQNSE